MTRSTHSSLNAVSIKPKQKSANISKLLLIILLVIISCSSYFYFHKSSLGDPSDQFVIKNIPQIYTKLETVEPDERDVFQGFKTSFLPPEEVFLAKEASRSDEDIPSDALLWGDIDVPVNSSRVKRKGDLAFESQEYDVDSIESKYKHDEYQEYEDSASKSESVSNEYDSSDRSENYNLKDNLESIVHPEPPVDRGPLDDVVEQVRGQPELEEGEMGTFAHLYKAVKAHTGIHSFWKGQGDKQAIRETQAKIMKQYMDPGADPCDDFYQYACGNWAALNPIPPDKAGYDTFEMLRESLDAVLKDLLEFKTSEHVPSTYPGNHLDLVDNILSKIPPPTFSTTETASLDEIEFIMTGASTDIFYANNTNRNKYYDVNDNRNEKKRRAERHEILKRIRRYYPPQINKHVKTNNRNRNAHVKAIKTKYFKNTSGSQHRNMKTRNMKPESKYRSTIRRTHQKRNAVTVGRRLHMYKNENRKSVKKSFKTNIRRKSKLKTRTAEKHQDMANGDAALKARFLFKSCMNYEILEKRGHQPLVDLLDLFGGWPILNEDWNSNHFDWLELMARLRLYNNDILISEWVGPDIKNSDEYVIQFDQTSLGLPTRDYFLQESNRIYLEAYKDYLIKIATLLGGNPQHVSNSADQLIEFEIKLAKITSAPEDRRNVSELYRRMPLSKLEELVPEVKWRRYLCVIMNRTVGSNETVVLFALSYVRHLIQLIHETEPSVLANYLLWRFVRHRVNNLDDRFQSAKQKFYFTLFGREQAPPRWKNCISQVNSNMGMALGSMFVRKHFDEMSKNDTLSMTREIQQSFRELLHMTDWIDDETKALAAHKVDAMMLRIGYPDFILDKKELDDRYKEVKIHPDKYFENILNILQHLTKMEQSRLSQPVNKTLWNTAPAVVNAYYSRNKNQIMFPAGILQPPFYHRHFPRSLNYGGIGVVIGHEITHGFDDKGRLFDCDGNLHRWWSDSAIEAFHRRAQCLIDQYSKYVVPEVNMKLDGVNTQGENIADNGGIKQAFRAYLRWLRLHNSKDETLPGLNHTHTQLFFLNFAQVWCGAMRPEAMRNKLKTAVHSPGRFRVIGTLSNSHDFAREFQCPPDSPMNPTQKCSVW